MYIPSPNAVCRDSTAPFRGGYVCIHGGEAGGGGGGRGGDIGVVGVPTEENWGVLVRGSRAHACAIPRQKCPFTYANITHTTP